MAGKGNLGFIAVCGLAIAAGGSYVYGKCKNFATRLKVAETKNELNDKIIKSQNNLIDELEKKLKRLGG